MGPLPPASLSEQGENDFQKWGRKTADITHLPSSLTSEKRGNSFFRKMGKYYLLFTRVLSQPSCCLRIIHLSAVSYSPAMQILQHCCISKIFRSLPCGTRYKIILIFQKEGLLQFGVQHDVSHRYVGGL